MTSKVFMVAGGLGGFAGVALGALAAHALRERLEPAALANVDTAARYLLVHAVLLVALAAWLRLLPAALAPRLAGYLIVSGMILFCGGLTLAALSGVHAFTRVAPAGGLALMAGWLTLLVFGLWKA